MFFIPRKLKTGILECLPDVPDKVFSAVSRMISRSGVCGLNFTQRSRFVWGAQPSRLPFGASRAEHECGSANKLKSVAVEDANGGTPLAATGTVAPPFQIVSAVRLMIS
jgi:hypothetical protein